MTHPEVYAPRIPLPAYAGDPSQRMTVPEVLRYSLVTDSHIPGYHLVMLGWDRVFGVGLFAIRFSSVLLGLLAILAMFAYARPLFGTSAALLASWLLALHGGHIFWSQSARPWVPLSFVGLISTVLLLRSSRNWTRLSAIGYVVITAIGLWIDYYFWPLFAAQVIWVMLNGARSTRMPRILAAQFGALILLSPMFIYLVEHMGRQRPIGGSPWPYLAEVLQFGGVMDWSQTIRYLGSAAYVLFTVVALVGLGSLITGLARQKLPESQLATETPGISPAPLLALLGTAAFTTALIEIVFAGSLHLGHRKIVLAAMAAPWMFVLLWLVLGRLWGFWFRTAGSLRISQKLLSLPMLLSVGVFALVLLMHLRKPFLVAYALIAFTPFWLAPMSAGLLAAKRFTRPLLAGLLALFVFTAFVAERAPNSTRDYQSLATQLLANVKPGDALWMRRLWLSEPVYYYMNPHRYTFAAPPKSGDQASAATHGARRIWLIEFGSPDEIAKRANELHGMIPDYRQAQRLSAFNAGAVLFEKGSN